MKRIISFVLIGFTIFLHSEAVIVHATDEQLTEMTELRTTHSKVYNPEGNKYIYEYYSKPIHYFNGEDYVEYNISIKTLEETNTLSSQSGNYQVDLSTNKNITNVELSYFDKEEINIDFGDTQVSQFGEVDVLDYDVQDFSTDTNHEFIIESTSTGLITKSEYSDKHEFISESYTIELNDLTLQEAKGEYYLVNKFNSPIYMLDDYYLIDSFGVVYMNLEVNVKELSDSSIEVEISNNSVNDIAELSYPITLYGGLSYSMISSEGIVRDKTIVKDTYEGYDTSIITVAKQTYYPFQYTPITLNEYLSYSIMEIDLHQFISPYISINSAVLNLERNTYNVNSKVPISEINNVEYDQIDGFTQYTKTLIASPFVSSSNVSYNIKDEVVNHINNTEPLLLLELSPDLISLGSSSIKYMNFVSENANQSNSPLLTIEYEDNTPSFGIAPDYYDTSSTDLNCFGYALRMFDTWMNIYNANGVIDFGNNQFDDDDFQSDIVPAVVYTINDQEYYSVRPIGENDSINSNEYRIALRIGDINTTSTTSVFLPSNTQQNTQDDFHFMIQLEDGNWAQKLGQYPSEELIYTFDVSNYDWDYERYINNVLNHVPNFYNSTTVYFAVSHSNPTKIW